MKQTTLPVALSVTRPQGGNYDDQQIEIKIEDRVSGVRFLEIKVSLPGFARLLTGLSNVPAMASYAALDTIGLIRETKTEHVTIPTSYAKVLTGDAINALSKFEVDGWVGYKSDLKNGHRMIRSGDGTSTYAVSFTRFVQPTPERSEARLAELKENEF